jgi:phytoene desaturase
MSESKKIIIIGAGFAGLSAASLLAKEGFDVTVIEKNSLPGGKVNFFQEKGFRFDTGPSWFMIPNIYEDFFAKFNKKFSDYVNYKKLDPSYRIYFDKNDHLDITTDINKTMELFERLEPNGGKNFAKTLKDSEEKYTMSFKHFLYRAYKNISNLVNFQTIPIGIRKLMFLSYEYYINKRFKSDKARKILSWHTVFLGGEPKIIPSVYTLMLHADFNIGTYVPIGGIYTISDALYKLAQENKVKFKFNERVKKIITENGHATLIETDKGKYEADIFISNADYHHTEMDLLKEKDRSYNEKFWNKMKMSPGVFLIYLGINKKIQNIRHHNYYFSKNWHKHFKTFFDDPSWPLDNPAYYVCCSTKSDLGQAPKNCENLFFLVPVASNLDDNEEIREKMYNQIISHFEDLIGEKIRENIIVKRIAAHKEQIQNYNSFKGSGFGPAQTLLQTGPLRPKFFSKKIKNLFFTGQYTHPGISMPMVIISAEILAKEILKKYGK